MSQRYPKLKIERVYESYAMAFYGGLILWVVDGHTPLAELQALRQHALQWHQSSPGLKTVALTILHARRTSMSAEERKEVMGMIDDTKEGRLASSTVVLSRGMMGALHRAILAGITLIVPPPHPIKVTANTEEAYDFLAPYLEEACGPLSLEEVLGMAQELLEVVQQRQLQGAGAPDGGGLNKG